MIFQVYFVQFYKIMVKYVLGNPDKVAIQLIRRLVLIISFSYLLAVLNTRHMKLAEIVSAVPYDTI